MQGGEQLAKRGSGQPDEGIGVEGAIEVGFGQAELGQLQQRVRCLGLAERIEVGQEMAEVAVGIDQADDADLGGLSVDSPPMSWALGLAQLEAVEEGPPGFVHRGGVGTQRWYSASIRSRFQRVAMDSRVIVKTLLSYFVHFHRRTL